MSVATSNGVNPPKVCVFCGASDGTDPVHLEAARELAQVLHENGAHLVYGGGTSGVMAEVAKTLVKLSGPDSVHGIIPQPLLQFERRKDEHGNERDPSELIDATVFGRTTIVKSMHERKAMMKEEVVNGGPGSGFVAMSGGFGTFEELLEMSTWNQLNVHAHPVVMFNIQGLYDGLLQTINRAVELGFIRKGNSKIIAEAKTAQDVWKELIQYQLAEGRLHMLKWQDDELA